MDSCKDCTHFRQHYVLSAGGEIETPPAFLLGVQGGYSLTRENIPPLFRSSATGAATPPAQSTGYFSSILLKK